MAKVKLICGKIGSGKSWYAQRLKAASGGLLLSCDELVFALSLEDMGAGHEALIGKIKAYLYQKAAEAVSCGVDAILDFGFWSRTERTQVSAYFRQRGIPAEWHYVAVSDEDWRRNIEERNALVLSRKAAAYFIDDGLFGKGLAAFEEPLPGDMDVWFENRRTGG